MLKLGKVIFESAKKAYPILMSGKSSIGKKAIFSLKNPYILEAIPQSKLQKMLIFEGKKLRTVCRILDDNDSHKIIERYNKILSKQQKGFSDSEIVALYKKAFKNNGRVPSPNENNLDAMVYLNNLPESIGSKFDAHGLAKVSIPDQLRQLNNLLTNGIDKTRKFYTAPLVGNGGIGAGMGTASHAYRDGSFIVVSDKMKLIVNDGIKHVIVNDAYYNIIKDLQTKFPNVNFVRADQAVEYFSKL